jgi:hypothetical protein
VTDVERLVEIWRRTRSARVADLVEHLAPGPASWPRTRDSWKKAHQVAQELASGPDDPRTVTALLQVIAHPPPFRIWAEITPFVHVVGPRLAELADPRLHPQIEAHLERPTSVVAEEVLKAVRNRLGSRPQELPLTADEERFVDAVERGHPRRDEAEIAALFDRVYRTPGDMALRHVLADRLLEEADPRGEFMSLQLRRGDTLPTREERQLLRQHRHDWLGPLSTLVSVAEQRWEGGFLAACKISHMAERMAPTIGEPSWATVSEITVDRLIGRRVSPPELVSLLRHQAMGSLHTVRFLDAQTVTRVADLAGLTTITFTTDGDLLAALEACAASPSLRRLGLHADTVEAMGALASHRVLGRLEGLLLDADVAGVAAALALAGAVPVELGRHVGSGSTPTGWHVAARGGTFTLRFHGSPDDIEGIFAVLEGIPADRPEAVSVLAPRLPPALAERITRSAQERYPRLQSLTVPAGRF